MRSGWQAAIFPRALWSSVITQERFFILVQLNYLEFNQTKTKVKPSTF